MKVDYANQFIEMDTRYFASAITMDKTYSLMDIRDAEVAMVAAARRGDTRFTHKVTVICTINHSRRPPVKGFFLCEKGTQKAISKLPHAL